MIIYALRQKIDFAENLCALGVKILTEISIRVKKLTFSMSDLPLSVCPSRIGNISTHTDLYLMSSLHIQQHMIQYKLKNTFTKENFCGHHKLWQKSSLRPVRSQQWERGWIQNWQR